MTKSIDLNNVSLMIGTSATVAFGGTFDGNNCSLLNIATKESVQYSGLFRAILAGGKVCNLSTYGAYNQTTKFNGVIAGNNYGTIENVTNYVTITPTNESAPGEVSRYTASIASYNDGAVIGCVNYGYIFGEEYASGIVSRLNAGTAKIENCINYADIKGSGQKASGIVGEGTVGGSVIGCINYGNVSGSSRVSGIISGTSLDVNVTNCINYGDITGTGDYAAGIAGGQNAGVVLSGCINYGNVSGGQWIGGIAALHKTNITNCVNYGNVTGTKDFIGGIVGASGCGTSGVTADRTLSGCINYGAVKGVGYVGGIDGRPYAGTVTYENCTNNGTVTATSTETVRGSAGGIVGRTDVVSATLIGCVSNGAVNATSAGIYVGLNTTSDTAGYVIYDSCSTTLTEGNAIGYDSTQAAGIPLEGFEYTVTPIEE